MRILQVHCRYVVPGGEDGVAEAERRMLEENGHAVQVLSASNQDVIERGPLHAMRSLWRAPWNKIAYIKLRERIRDFRPNVVHVHNFWFALSPAVFGAAYDCSVPTVMTLHNYRLLCTNGLFLRRGRVCERCLGKSTWRAIPLRCYRDSALQTAAVTRMIQTNRRRGTWRRGVDAYIALTDFARRKFVEGGLPSERIYLKPNFLETDPGPAVSEGRGAVFVGRLSPEKGIEALTAAWKLMPASAALKIIGDGPMYSALKAATQKTDTIQMTGLLDAQQVLSQLKEAAFLVFPSIWFETFGLTLIEAFACGRPALASRLGAMAEMIRDGYNGLLFEPGNPTDLAAKAKWLLDHPEKCARMGRNARREFEEKYTAGANYHRLLEIYEAARQNHDRALRVSPHHRRQT